MLVCFYIQIVPVEMGRFVRQAWYDVPVPKTRPYIPKLPAIFMPQNVEAAVEHAKAVRHYHARNTRKENKQRDTDIKVALQMIQEAMKPLRTCLAKLPHEDQPWTRAELRKLSDDLQRERRKLWKMQSNRQRHARGGRPPNPKPAPPDTSGIQQANIEDIGERFKQLA